MQYILGTENSKKYFIKGENKAIYNATDFTFKLTNISFIGEPNTQVIISVKSNLIRIENRYNQLISDDYSFDIFINILKCQKGEIPFNYNELTECKICPEQ